MPPLLFYWTGSNLTGQTDKQESKKKIITFIKVQKTIMKKFTYGINMKIKIMISMIQGFEKSLYLPGSTAMNNHSI